MVGGAFLPVQLAFELAVFCVGVDHVDQVTSGAGEVGGVEAPRMLQQGLLAAGTDRGPRRQGLDRPDDHIGLLG